MSDFNDYNEEPSRRRRRDYTDDAWGMSEYEDYADGSAGDVEDYAGGLVPEERSRYQRDEPNDYESGNENQYTVASNAPQNQWRSQHIGTNSSDGIDQAARLLERMNARNSYPAGGYPTDQPRQLSSGRRSARAAAADSTTSFYAAVVMILLLLLVISCMILGFYATFG